MVFQGFGILKSATSILTKTRTVTATSKPGATNLQRVPKWFTWVPIVFAILVHSPVGGANAKEVVAAIPESFPPYYQLDNNGKLISSTTMEIPPDSPSR